MRWLGRRASGNVDDRRGSGMGGKIALGGVGTIIVIVLTLVMGGDPSDVINVISNNQTQQAAPPTAEENEQAEFIKVVLADTEDAWNKIFAEQLNKKYEEPVLVLFTGTDQSGCGTASAATGPFYCPADRKVYIDLSFYNDLKQRFDAPGDFAMAYVVAHEVGHHVQNLLGTAAKVRQQQSGLSEKEVNALSVRLELQADFYAGVWAHYNQKLGVLEPGDIEEALTAANAIGDDRLQKEANGRVVPDAFTHGTSEQRMYWFKKGYETGDISQGNTFE
ncbi:MAG: metalloprotease [Cytophagaceae bacterium]|jgi:predicted metalloprotease|nr:metalloprotease [Cytophagaceae bacterium]